MAKGYKNPKYKDGFPRQLAKEMLYQSQGDQNTSTAQKKKKRPIKLAGSKPKSDMRGG